MTTTTEIPRYPPVPSDLPLVTLRHEVAPWKIHFLQLVAEVPKATPVPSDQFPFNHHEKFSSSSGSSSNSLRYSEFKSCLEANNSTTPGANSSNTGGTGTVLRLKRQRLIQARIASLRLEIGDLSVSENLEKLCDHYFKLDKKGHFKKRQTVRVTSDIYEDDNDKSTEEEHLESGGGSFDEDDEMNIPGFGKLFHGLLTKSQTEKRLVEEGQFLVRQICQHDGLILSFRFDDEIRNYKISYEVSEENSKPAYFLEDRKKAYESLEALVQDGLTTMYLDMKAGFYVDIMTELAQINKHDSTISPTSGGGTSLSPPGPMSRKNSGVTVSRQVSQQMSSDFRMSRALSTTSSSDSLEMELKRHWFLEEKFNKKMKLNCPVTDCMEGTLRFKTGLVCKDCGVTIHNSCLENANSDCNPELSKIPQIFGTELTTLVKAAGGCGPPFVLEICIREIELRGFQSEGIYRVSGYQELILQLQNAFERDRENTDLTTCEDINSICGLIKLFLRQLPEPLITKDVFEAFLAESGFITLESVKKNMKMLPAAHKITLKYLMEHLQRVAKEREINKMSPFNLSSVLAPSIIVPEDINLNTLKMGTDLVEVLIKNVHILFD